MICGLLKNGTQHLVGRMILRYAGEKANGKRMLKLLRDSEAATFEVDSPLEDEVLRGMMV